MKNKVSQIVHYLALAVLLHLLQALAPVMAQNVARTGETTTFTITPQPGDTYTWTLYNDPTVNFAVDPGTVTQSYAEFIGDTNSSTVNILWKEAGVYFFKVNATDITGCAQNFKIGQITVLPGVKATIEASPVVCAGETVSLTVTLTGTPPWEYTYTDGTSSWTRTNILTSPDVITLTPGPVITTEYWITTVKDKYGINATPSDKAKQEINPLPAKTTIYHR